MSNLQISTNPETQISAYIDQTTGEAFLTKTLVCELLAVHNQTFDLIIAQSEGVLNYASNYPETLTDGGIQGVQFLLRAIDLKHIIKAVLKGRTKDKSKAIAVQDKLIDAGATAFVYNLCGYEMKQSKPKTALELAREHAELALQQVKLLEELELQKELNASLELENNQLSEAVDDLFDYSSIIRIAKYNNVSEKSFNWRLLKAASQKLAVEIKKVPCPRFVEKSLYPHTAWRLAYPGYKLPETTTLVIKR